MRYFAYGSNMLEERLKSENRVPDAAFQATGYVEGYRLRFHKRSNDGSGKCNIVETGSADDVVCGVIFEVPDSQLRNLDRAEGLGQGYHHEDDFPVRLADGTTMPTLAYVADSTATDDNLIPYVWYHRLVVAGAEQHRLPEDYIAELRRVQFLDDPEPNRHTKLEAEAALNAYYGSLRA
jgi:gamma-glutamylcyclotransferase